MVHGPTWMGRKFKYKRRWQGLQDGQLLREVGLARFVLHVQTYRLVRG